MAVNEVLFRCTVLRRPVHALLRGRPRDGLQEAAFPQPTQPFAQPAPPRFLRTVGADTVSNTPFPICMRTVYITVI